MATLKKSRRMIGLRRYQQRIVNEALANVHGGTIVVLPTGAGKTLVAAEMTLRTGAAERPPGKLCACTLFLVPTIVLVEQQAKAVIDWHRQNGIASSVAEYHGGKSLPTQFDVLVSTPGAFAAAQMRSADTSLAWTSFDLLVVDEVHHCDPKKDHPYRKLATSLMTARQRETTAPMPTFLGLTASLTYATKNMEDNVEKLCRLLGVTKIRSADDEELARDGYQGTRAAAQTVANVGVAADLVPHKDRKPHLQLRTFHQRVDSGQATPFTLRLMQVVRSLESCVSEVDTEFQSPLQRKPIGEWEKYTDNMRAKQSTSRNSAKQMMAELVHWYGAIKLLAISWEEDDFLAVTFLRMNEVSQSYAAPPVGLSTTRMAHCALASDFFAKVPQQFARLCTLKDTLMQLAAELEREGRKFRGIVFVQQRVTTHILKYFVSTTPALSAHFRPAVVYSSSSAATPSLSCPAGVLKAAMARFATGESNLLICTSNVEEGMDVAESNCVICFDPIQNPVALVQRRGRARQSGSKFVVLSERSDRTVRDLETIETIQRKVCSSFEVPKRTPAQLQKQRGDERAKQMMRERGAVEKMRQQIVKVGKVTPQNALGILQTFCKQTKVDLEIVESASDGGYTLKYDSITRCCEGRAQGSKKNKKNAKRQAAVKLVLALQGQLGHAVACEPTCM
jgi:ERCC4-related helicase